MKNLYSILGLLSLLFAKVDVYANDAQANSSHSHMTAVEYMKSLYAEQKLIQKQQTGSDKYLVVEPFMKTLIAYAKTNPLTGAAADLGGAFVKKFFPESELAQLISSGNAQAEMDKAILALRENALQVKALAQDVQAVSKLSQEFYASAMHAKKTQEEWLAIVQGASPKDIAKYFLERELLLPLKNILSGDELEEIEVILSQQDLSLVDMFKNLQDKTITGALQRTQPHLSLDDVLKQQIYAAGISKALAQAFGPELCFKLAVTYAAMASSLEKDEIPKLNSRIELAKAELAKGKKKYEEIVQNLEQEKKEKMRQQAEYLEKVQHFYAKYESPQFVSEVEQVLQARADNIRKLQDAHERRTFSCGRY